MLTITVLDTATIFEGNESIFRYDLPGSGVVEGWALAGVIEQAAKLAGPAWPGVDVTVVADATGGAVSAVSAEAVEVIVRHLRMSGVTGVRGGETETVVSPRMRPAATDSRVAAAEGADGLADAAASPRPSRLGTWGSRRGGSFGRWGKKAPIMVAAGMVAVIAVGGIILWPSARPFEPASSEVSASLGVEAGRVGKTSQALAAPKASLLPGESVVAAAPANAGEREHIEAGGMSLELPRGFHWSEESGLYTATGADPSLRILFAADPLYSVPADVLLTELRVQIDSDETLSEPAEVSGRMTYLERPGDGSEVRWTTWIERDQQLSVGCHTRGEATLAHKAACRMASESLALK